MDETGEITAVEVSTRVKPVEVVYKGIEETDRYKLVEIIEAEKNGKKVIVVGLNHTRNLEDCGSVLEKFNEFLSRKNVPEGDKYVLVEGVEFVEIARKELEKDPLQTPEQIINRYGEQALIAYLALKSGIKVESWDMSFREQLKQASERFGTENTAVWFLSQSFIHLRNQGLDLTIENAINQVSQQVGIPPEELKRLTNLEDEDEVKRNIESRLGYSLEDISSNEETYRRFSRLADPTLTEEELKNLSEEERAIIQIPREMGRIRDEHALRKIEELLSTNRDREVFVTCGKVHAEEWVIMKDWENLWT